MTDMTIGFIGAGNMGSALARAVRRAMPKAQLLIANRTAQKAQNLAEELNGHAVGNTVAAQKSDFLFLGVKPGQLLPLLAELTPVISARSAGSPVLVSMAAGVSLEALERVCQDAPVIRIMPNTPVAVGRGVTLYTCGREVSEQVREGFSQILAGSGSLVEVTEAQMAAGGKISGCGPAFVDLFLEALADGGVASGLPRDLALRLAEETVAGTAALALETGQHPGQLKDAVCSPGGSTIQGIRQLERAGFRSAVIEAVIAANLQ